MTTPEDQANLDLERALNGALRRRLDEQKAEIDACDDCGWCGPASELETDPSDPIGELCPHCKSSSTWWWDDEPHTIEGKGHG